MPLTRVALVNRPRIASVVGVADDGCAVPWNAPPVMAMDANRTWTSSAAGIHPPFSLLAWKSVVRPVTVVPCADSLNDRLYAPL